MIYGISGRPGGGKSYEAVKNHVLPILKEGRKVVTNLPLVKEHIKATYGQEAADLVEIIDGLFHSFGDNDRPFSKYAHFERYFDWKNEKGQGAVFFIDECHLAMPAGACEKKLLEFLSLHRHYGFDIYLITQDFRKVHRDIRAMIEINYRCIKKTAIGRTDAYILKVCQGAESSSPVVNTSERKYESWVFEFYNSHTKSDKKVEEAYTKDIKPWWMAKKVLFSIPMLLIGFFWTVSSASDLLSPKPRTSKPVEELKSPGQKPQQLNGQEQPKPVQPPKPQFSHDNPHPFKKLNIHVAGVYRDINEKIVYFSLSYNGVEVNRITNVDLMMAGYKVEVFSDCAVQLTYDHYKDFAICDQPTVGFSAPVNVAAVQDQQ